MARLFFIFWIRSNIFRNFSGCRRPIFNCFYIIRFVFSLAFQCCIRNCSTAKTSKDIAKRKRKVEIDGLTVLQLLWRLDTVYHIQSQTKSFCLRMMKFGTQHPETGADTEKKTTGRCDNQGCFYYNIYTGQDFSRILYSKNEIHTLPADLIQK